MAGASHQTPHAVSRCDATACPSSAQQTAAACRIYNRTSWYIWMHIKQDVLSGCHMTLTSGCTSTTHILFLACTERMASILVPYWFSLYSPCSMNLNRDRKFMFKLGAHHISSCSDLVSTRILSDPISPDSLNKTHVFKRCWVRRKFNKAYRTLLWQIQHDSCFLVDSVFNALHQVVSFLVKVSSLCQSVLPLNIYFVLNTLLHPSSPITLNPWKTTTLCWW